MASVATSAQDVTLDRLEDQLGWYERKSAANKRAFQSLKVCTIVSAAFVPIFAVYEVKIVAASLGAFIAIVESVQQLFQFHANWMAYRSTSEALKHEKFLYMANAGPYGGATVPHALLAERIESLVSQEHAKWASGQEQNQRAAEPGKNV